MWLTHACVARPMQRAGKIVRTETKNDADKNDGMSLPSKCGVFQAGYCSAATAGPAVAIVRSRRCAQLFNAMISCYSGNHDARRLSYCPGSLLGVALLPAGVRDEAHCAGDRQLGL